MPKSFLLKRKFKEDSIDVVGGYDSDGESWRTGQLHVNFLFIFSL